MVALLPNISFQLKSNIENRPTSIRMLFYHRDFGKEGRFIYGTGETILPYLFNPVTQRPETDKSKLRSLSKEEQRELRLIEGRLDLIKVTTHRILENLAAQNKRPDKNTLKKMLDQELKATGETKRKKHVTLIDYVKRYTEELIQGERLTDGGKVFTPGSIQNYDSFRSQAELFEKKTGCSLRFEDIDQDFYNDFVRFLNAKNYSPNTIGKHIARLKKLLRSAKEDGLYQGEQHEKKYFKVLQTPTEHVYLTEEELNKLAKLDLSGKGELELYRDVFLIGCHTAQRVSDYKQIRPEHIMKTSEGVRILRIIQQKTGEEVMIPIRKELDDLLKKYNYHPPVVQEQKLNGYLKDLGKMASIDTPVEIEMIRGGRKIRKVFPKFELIKTHSARRTGATLMYLANIPSIDIMKITGHKKESNFLKYICVTREETANKLSKHLYFK
jgi:integrase